MITVRRDLITIVAAAALAISGCTTGADRTVVPTRAIAPSAPDVQAAQQSVLDACRSRAAGPATPGTGDPLIIIRAEDSQLVESWALGPSLVVYTDGAVAYASPPRFATRTLPCEVVSAAVATLDLWLWAPEPFGMPTNIYDGGTTGVSVAAHGAVAAHARSLYSSGMEDVASGLTDDQRAARSQFRDLVTTLSSAGEDGDQLQLDPIVVWTDISRLDYPSTAQPWPLATPSNVTPGSGPHCQLLSGAEAATLVAALGPAHNYADAFRVRFAAGDAEFDAIVRVAVPRVAGCPG